jgi:surface protein
MRGSEKLNNILNDIATSIRKKTNSSNLIKPEDFASLIEQIGSTSTPERPTYTGHADAEGLRAIGWTDEDIAYYQENGVNWNEEDDQYHLVSDDNKALYGVLTADNISTYKDRIVYLPKIDTSGKTSMTNMFKNCYSLVSIPQLDTTKVTDMTSMF